MQKAGTNIDHLLVSGRPVLVDRPKGFSKNPPGFFSESEEICLMLTLDTRERLLRLMLALARHVADINICNGEFRKLTFYFNVRCENHTEVRY